MKTTVTLSINRIDREFDLTFKGTLYDYEVESMDFYRWNVDHLINDHLYDLEEAIVNYFVGEAEYRGEEQMELERGN